MKPGPQFVTVTLPFAERTEWNPLLEADVLALLEPLGNPLGASLRKRVDALGIVHFFSINVVRAMPDDPTSFVLLEATLDGDAREGLAKLAEALCDDLFPALSLACGIEDRSELPRLLERHRRRLSSNPLRLPRTLVALPFAGLPGLSVEQILAGGLIAEKAERLLADLRAVSPHQGPQNTFRDVANRIEQDPDLVETLARLPDRLLFSENEGSPWIANLRKPSNPIRDFLGVTSQWLLLLMLPPFLFAFGLMLWVGDVFPLQASWRSAGEVARAAMIATFPAILFIAALVGLLLWLLRRAEKANIPRDRDPEPATMAAMMTRENHASSTQNHMISVTIRQRGFIRRLALSAAFTAIATAGQLKLMRTGFLGSIGTIHSARFMMMPRSRRLVFVSNYDGSWESYLEDFITKASLGVTGVWSNTEGFPRSRFLFWDGAKDGDRMKRYARHSMQPTAVWYSAYPKLSCEQGRRQALIANGLKCRDLLCESASAAEAWLSLFGSVPRPDFALEYEEIQALLFGGLKHHRFGHCIAIGFGEPRRESQLHPYAHVQEWLAQLRVTFGDLPPPALVCNIAFSAAGLRKLGLEEELSLDPLVPSPPKPDAPPSFPASFAMGMAHPARKRLLRDPEQLDWCDDTVDAVLLLYAHEAGGAGRFDAHASRIAQAGMQVLRRIDTQLTPFDRAGFESRWKGEEAAPGAKSGDAPDSASDALTAEPFGFVDDLSQPRVRGFPGRQGRPDPVHAVEPGEFILGYADNRGFLPPSPHVARPMDRIGMSPQRILSATMGNQPQRFPDFAEMARRETGKDGQSRDFGRNGSYLVIRELEQDVEGFNRHVASLAGQLCGGGPDMPGQPDPLNPHPENPDRAAEWLMAKMVGRWRNGSSLVENPHKPNFAGSTRKEADNRFLFRDADAQGMRCPFGAHIRRAFPRDSLDPSLPSQLEVSNRHRLLRRGRPYLDEDGKPAGTLFMCFNADLERQFEFVQQTWINASDFHGLSGEGDPFAMHGKGDTDGPMFTIPGPSIPLKIGPLETYVNLKGGGYFFMPGRHALWFLSGRPWMEGPGLELLMAAG